MSESNYWTRLHRRRLSRRTLLGASAKAGVGAAGLALVGCGDDDDEQAVAQAQVQAAPAEEEQAAQVAEQAQAQEQAVEEQAQAQAEQAQAQAGPTITRGGVVQMYLPLPTWDSMDPHRGVFGPTQAAMGLYMNNLIRWRNKEQGVMEADIASLPEIPDDTTYIFSVDQGARFWDRFPTEGGRAVTAEDIRFNYQRNIDAVDSTGAADGTFLSATRYRQTSAVEVVDEKTIRMMTAAPDATWLGAVPLAPFSWITSPEAAAAFGDRWRDESTNVELSSGTGYLIPVTYEPDTQLTHEKNPNYHKVGADGQPLSYFDNLTWTNLADPTAVEAAYRGKQIYTAGFPLSKLQTDGIKTDFPDHRANQVAFGFTIQTGTFNFNPEWPGEDGLGNPWLDRRMAYAFQMAVDRLLMVDTVYLGDAKLSGLAATPWFNAFWSIPQEELLSVPGYRPNREQDITELRALIDASGFDKSRTINIMAPDIWEGTYAGIVEIMTTMFREATGLNVEFEIQPYTVILQRLVEGTYPGNGPQWTNPPSDLDPTSAWISGLAKGAATNFQKYDYPPAEEIFTTMKSTLDLEARKEMGLTVQRILLGTHPDHGLDGISPSFGVMNGIQTNMAWPFMNFSPDLFQFAHAFHRFDETWMDTAHPDFPA